MTGPQKLRRIITCQGGIQLVAALAALSTRENEQKASGANYEYENYLVVYDLYAPLGQLEDFADVIRRMAVAAREWANIVYISKKQIDEIEASVNSLPTNSLFTQVYRLVGVTGAEEIYLCRNWQFGNRLMINAYRAAEKICYGDSIGIYFSEAYLNNRTKSLRETLGGLKISLKEKFSGPSKQTPLEEVDFDIGYFLLPDILGQQPPMPTRLVKKECMYEVFCQLADALEPDNLRGKYMHIANPATVFLMTSNFSEASRMTIEDELKAYREFMERQKFSSDSALVIKPHPRDAEEKIQQLRHTMLDLFSDVICLSEPNLFFIPFEIFLLQTFKGETEKALRNLRIVTFSTACLSLQALFNLKPKVGFGNELVRKFFYQDYVDTRINHEKDLKLALERLGLAS